jgi:cellulose synthase/poly-beta-1,6-N-acetylglucosamine synthase-like glycosyltransferase
MDVLLQILFWSCIFILFYTYIGYGLLLGLVNVITKRNAEYNVQEFPEISLVIAGYNEAVVLKQKLENSLSLDYPKDKLKIIFVSDGSTDETMAILQQYPQVFFIEKKQRQGKAAALNTAMQYIQTPFVVFSDANGMLNNESIKNVVMHFVDPAIGAVAGEKKIIAHSGVGEAEGIYWQYESVLKKIDAQFYTVLSATGELFALRTELFQPLDENIILDDFVLSMQVCLKGCRIAYEQNAFSAETATASIQEEERRKVRIAAGAFQVLDGLEWRKVLSNTKLFFQFVSRRWLRWVICPIAIPIVLIANFFLINVDLAYQILLMLQLLFYLFAFIGFVSIKNKNKSTITAIPFYFLFMNFCMIKGYIQFKQNKQTVLWQKAKRHGS